MIIDSEARTLPALTDQQAEYISRWIELYAIRPVGIPADGAPIEQWEARIINTLRTWGTLRKNERLLPPDEPDEDEEPCRCCAGPGFGQGDHVHDEDTCEHPCCPGRDS